MVNNTQECKACQGGHTTAELLIADLCEGCDYARDAMLDNQTSEGYL